MVFDFSNLHHKVTPFLAVKREDSAFLILLGDNQISLAIGIGTSIEILEVRLRQELMVVIALILELFAHEDILLMNGIAFTEGLGKCSDKMIELIVAVYVGRILLHWVLHLQDGRIFASLGVEHANAIHILNREVDVLKDFLALSSGSKGRD